MLSRYELDDRIAELQRQAGETLPLWSGRLPLTVTERLAFALAVCYWRGLLECGPNTPDLEADQRAESCWPMFLPQVRAAVRGPPAYRLDSEL